MSETKKALITFFQVSQVLYLVFPSCSAISVLAVSAHVMHMNNACRGIIEANTEQSESLESCVPYSATELEQRQP